MQLQSWSISLACAAAVVIAPFAAASAAEPAQTEPTKISGPHTHENLSIYFLHGTSKKGPVPLTLGEAMAGGHVIVHETGDVQRLMIENTSDKEVFVQAGDIVKGGRQDRVLTISLVLPPKSGKLPIGAYCVEQGRWARRGIESTRKFSSSTASLPSREAKMAMFAAKPKARRAVPTPRVRELGSVQRRRPQVFSDRLLFTDERHRPQTREENERRATEIRRRLEVEQRRRMEAEEQRRVDLEREMRELRARSPQSEVWENVATIQRSLTARLGTSVASGVSSSSLQLTLENQKLAEAQNKLLAVVEPLAEKDKDVIGYAFAINGRINSVELYPSNGLFKKMWPKLIRASVTEALAKQSEENKTAPTIKDVEAFMADANSGKSRSSKLEARLTRVTRESKRALFLATKRADGTFVHRSILASY